MANPVNGNKETLGGDLDPNIAADVGREESSLPNKETISEDEAINANREDSIDLGEGFEDFGLEEKGKDKGKKGGEGEDSPSLEDGEEGKETKDKLEKEAKDKKPVEEEDKELPLDPDLLDDKKLEEKQKKEAEEKAKKEGQQQQQQQQFVDGENMKVFKAMHQKNMANNTRQWVQARMRELDDLSEQNKSLQQLAEERQGKLVELEKVASEQKEGKFPSSYYEHPEAYKLSPEFTKHSALANENYELAKFYKTQMIKARKGEKVQLVVAGPDGKPQLSQEVDASPEIQVQIEDLARQHEQQSQQAFQQSQLIKQDFEAMPKAIKTFVDKVQERFFPEYKDFGKTHKEYEIYEKIDKVMLPEIKAMPLYPILSRAYLAINKDRLKIKQLERELAQAKADSQLESQTITRKDTKDVTAAQQKNKGKNAKVQDTDSVDDIMKEFEGVLQES